MTKKWLKGDKLRVVKATDLDSGDAIALGDIVTARDDHTSDNVCITTTKANGGVASGYFAWRFEKVEQEVKGIRVGDTVEVIYGGAGVSAVDMGKTAIVLEVHPTGVPGQYETHKLVVDGKDFVYNFYNDKRRISADPKSFKKVTPVAPVVDTIIRVGDTVEVITGGYGVATDVLGKTGVVLEVNSGMFKRAVVDTANFGTTRYGKSIGITPVALKKVAPAVDFTKPLFTIEGTPVQLVSTAGRDTAFPVLVYEGTAKDTSKYSLAGKSKYGAARRNLTNAEPKPPEPLTVTGYLNLYSDGSTSNAVQPTRAKADDLAAAVERMGQRKRIAVTKVTLVAGNFDA
jgi:hypothetical protein